MLKELPAAATEAVVKAKFLMNCLRLLSPIFRLCLSTSSNKFREKY